MSFDPWVIAMTALILASTLLVFFYMIWLRERRVDRMNSQEFQRKQLEIELERLHVEKYERHQRERREEEGAVRRAVGEGTGGFIVVDLPDKHRSLFHDLLKGFEEYSRLKGYSVSFSIDSTFPNRIAFKFTLTDSGVVVGADRVRKDFREYLGKVQSGDAFEDIPVVTSIEEHELVVTTLKNRISFLQHSYNLEKNARELYEMLVQRIKSMPVLPAQNVVVQTGGSHNAPSYTALNSPRALLGDSSTFADQSVRVNVSFKERQAQLASIVRLLELLEREAETEHRNKTRQDRACKVSKMS